MGEFDRLAGEAAPKAKSQRGSEPKPDITVPVLKVSTLPEVLNYETPKGALMIGDEVIELGGIALLFGPPGSFNGFAVGQVMALGAQGSRFSHLLMLEADTGLLNLRPSADQAADADDGEAEELL